MILNSLKMINILMMRVTKSKLKGVNIDNKIQEQINKEINSGNHKIINIIIIIIEIHKLILISSSIIISINIIIDKVIIIVLLLANTLHTHLMAYPKITPICNLVREYWAL